MRLRKRSREREVLKGPVQECEQSVESQPLVESRPGFSLHSSMLWWRSRPDLVVLLWGIVVGLGICWPLMNGGRVFSERKRY
jgi:hypothetical protein